MSELKPCPFCGREAEEDSYKNNNHIPCNEGWIGCRCCRVFMNYTHGDRGRKLAVEAWNRRAERNEDEQQP